ncbi:MAG: large repetitive protein [Frankiaceae bacterium]|nr:large repetitive protein [Frankiaceae bacterium]
MRFGTGRRGAAVRRAGVCLVLIAGFILAGANVASAAVGPTISPQQPSPGNTRDLGWDVVAGDPADALECRLDGPAGVVLDWTPCGPTFSTTLPATAADGDYTATVREQTATGPATATDVYTLQTAAPADPTFTATPTTPSTASTAGWAWTAPTGVAECMLTGPSNAFAWQACPGGAFSTGVTVDGSYVFTVRSVDALGNRSAGVSSTFVRDTTGPGVTVAVSPAISNGSPAPRATFSIAPTDTAVCSVSQGGATLVGPTACSSPWTVPVAGLADGDYVVTVRATDALGNSGAPDSAGLRLDRVGPVDFPQITSGPGAVGNDPTPTWSFTVAAGETAECMFGSATQTLTPWTPCSSPVTTSSLTGRAETTYTLSIRAVDDAGNTGPVTTSDYLYDVTPPAAPSLSLSAPAGATTTVTATWPETETAICRVLRPDGTVASVVSPCTSPAVLTVPAVEATYTIRVRLTDAAGNTGPAASATYRYDVTAPTLAPTVVGPPSGNTTTPVFTITGTEAGESFLCTWDLAGTARTPVSCGPGAWVSAPALSGDGLWTLTVVGKDLAGNLSPATSKTYLLDTGPPPAPVITLVGKNPGNDVTPTWTFTAEPLATTQCQLNLGATVLSPWGPCPGGTVTYDLTPLDPTVTPDGDYTLFVRATDAAGNTGALGSSTYSLDTIAPGAPSFTSQPTGPARLPATWTFSVAGNNAECQLLFAGSPTAGWAACSSPWTPALGLDGDYQLSVRAVDTAGNVGPGVTSVGFEYDTLPPGLPVLTQQPATPSPDQQPTVGFAVGSTESAECRVAQGSTTILDWATCTTPWNADLTSEPDGTYSLDVRAVDQAGNRGTPLSVAYDLDSTAPPTATFTLAPTGPSQGRSPSFSFDVVAGTSAECQVTTAAGVLLDWTPCTSPYTLALPTEPDGSYSLGVRLVDAAGNRSAVTTATYLLDTTPPAAPVFGKLPPSPTSDAQTDWRWTGESGAKASCQVVSAGRVVSAWRACTSPHRVSLAGQPDGTYTLQVRLTDAAGNTGAVRSASVVRDTTAPVIVLTSVPTSPTSSDSPTWAWTTESGSSVSCLLTRGAVVVMDWRPCSGALTANLAGLPDGTYRLSLRAVDRAGNMGPVVSSSVLVTSGSVTPPSGGSGGTPKPGNGGPSTVPPPVVPPAGTGGSGPDGTTAPPPRPTQPSGGGPKPPAAHSPVPHGGSIIPPDPINRVPELLGRAAVRSLDRPQVPVILLILVILFLLVQNRIDRRDPKLANAPLGAEPTLGFGRLGGT